MKSAVEYCIPVEDIIKPVIPKTTVDIINSQKQLVKYKGENLNQSVSKDLLEDFLLIGSKGSISNLAKIGLISKNSELYKQKCLEANYYPFAIALQKGRLDLIATSYDVLKQWIIGINLLISHKKNLPRIRRKLS